MHETPDANPNANGDRAETPPTAARGAWSGLAVAASLALVGFAVIFGIYGPPLGDRGNPPIGTSLFELADVTRSVHDELVFDAIHSIGRETPATDGTGPSEAGPSIGEVSAAARRIMGVDFRAPDLTQQGFRALVPRATRVTGTPSGASSANVVYVRGSGPTRDFVTLTLIPDDEQFVVFDEFGRPRFIPINRPITIDISSDGFGRRLALAWTDGNVVHVAHSSRPECLDEVYDSLTRSLAAGDATDNPAGTAEPTTAEEPAAPAAP